MSHDRSKQSEPWTTVLYDYISILSSTVVPCSESMRRMVFCYFCLLLLDAVHIEDRIEECSISFATYFQKLNGHFPVLYPLMVGRIVYIKIC